MNRRLLPQLHRIFKIQDTTESSGRTLTNRIITHIGNSSFCEHSVFYMAQRQRPSVLMRVARMHSSIFA